MTNLPKTNGKIIPNASLAKYSWFQVGGNADILFEPKDTDDLIFFLSNVDRDIPITVIGGGSNTIIRDGGVRGIAIVLKNTMDDIKLNGDGNIEVGAGINNFKLYSFAKNNEIGGLEFLGTIPGTLGGAIRGNSGCYGSEIKDVLLEFQATDFKGNLQTFKKNDFLFEYRKNKLPSDLIFVKATIGGQNKKNPMDIETTYREMIEKRNASQPQGVKTCGSTFKNPPEKPAWKIIQELGYQNREINGVKMSEKHANFMVNVDAIKANDLEDLGNKIIASAKADQNIDLEWEIRIIGER